MSILYISQANISVGGRVSVLYSAIRHAQQITTGSDFIPEKFEVYIAVESVPTGMELMGKIYAATSNVPSGSAIASGAVSLYGLTTAEQWVTITMDSGAASLSSGQDYCLDLQLSKGFGTLSGEWNLLVKSGDVYTGGVRSVTSGAGSWATVTITDWIFKVYGAGISPNNLPINFGDKTYTKRWVAAVGSQIKWEKAVGSLVVITAVGDLSLLDTTKPLSMVEAYQKVFVANNTAAIVIDFANARISTADMTSVYLGRGTILTGGTSSAQMVVDYITATASACTIYGKSLNTNQFTAAEVATGQTSSGAAITMAVAANQANAQDAPFAYPWKPYANSSTIYGVMPTRACGVALYRGRLVLMRDPGLPHQWYMTKVGDPYSLIYNPSDPLTAVAGNNTDMGEVGDIVMDGMALKDDYFVFGCANSFWYMAGDPVAGGSLNELDLSVGLFNPGAWCFDGKHTIYFWGDNGLYKVEVPSKEGVNNITKLVLPDINDDDDLDPSKTTVSMGFDRFRNGVVVGIANISTGTNKCYFYDISTEGIFPEIYDPNCTPTCIANYNAIDPDYKDLMVGCADGYIRHFDNNAKSDQTADSYAIISSYVLLPLLTGKDEDMTTKIRSMVFVASGGNISSNFTDLDEFKYSIYVAKDAESLVENVDAGAAAFITGNISAPGRTKITRKVSANYIGLKLSNSVISSTWAVNRIAIDPADSGKV